ncbi:glycosyltransferase family 4 protein [Pedobacter sp. ISL-64]|uniref:glycosyltransferase family 4 protein n=1 Tax=Pedobacter sp. ISL-64 TaxID=2819164 RepID=UPI001BEAC5DD|nr:glycosyltransferase family 4 protein [Pedobacter sp. ISL-64]MBT2562760.1 glycosyltransferase family 4 protein [Pedobacter sp. ISL-64]
MKIILSQGQGRIQLGQAGALLKESGIKVKYLTGWLPKKINPIIVNFLGKIVGRADLYKRLMVRQPVGLDDDDIISCSKSEFYLWFLIILVRLKLLKEDNALTWGWRYLGKETKKHIKDADIFHVRSGAGQGGAIEKAKKENMITIADHSIAHPISMKEYLIEEYKRFNQKYDLDPNSKFWTLVEKDCLDADYVLVNSDFVKNTFLDNGYREDIVKVIYFGVREDFVGLKTDWSFVKKDAVHLIFIGHFCFRKGARILIEAIKELNERGVSVVLDVLGIVDDLKIPDIPSNIVFHGIFLYDELKDHLKNSDLYVFPTFAEGSSRAAMEAMASGLPVITTENCGVPIVHDETGVIIPINNSMILADEIERLINDKMLREKIGRSASKLISEKYTWGIYKKNLVDFYELILDKKNDKK